MFQCAARQSIPRWTRGCAFGSARNPQGRTEGTLIPGRESYRAATRPEMTPRRSLTKRKEPPSRSVGHQYYIDRTPAEVFRAITDPAMLVRWLSDTARIDLRTGGSYLLGWKDGPQHTGTVAEYVPGQRLSLTWQWPGIALEGTRFSLSVEPEGRGTLLSVEHSGFPKLEKWTDLYGGAEWGWTYFAMNLKSVLESGRDLRSPHDG